MNKNTHTHARTYVQVLSSLCVGSYKFEYVFVEVRLVSACVNNCVWLHLR